MMRLRDFLGMRLRDSTKMRFRDFPGGSGAHSHASTGQRLRDFGAQVF